MAANSIKTKLTILNSRMRIFKFGGVSIETAKRIEAVGDIIEKHIHGGRLIIIISALGKTTNALEKVLDAFVRRKGNALDLWKEVFEAHKKIASELLSEDEIEDALGPWNELVTTKLNADSIGDKSFEYDQLVSMGELLSTSLVTKYLVKRGLPMVWLDARKLVCTDDNYKEAHIDWELTCKHIQSTCLNRSMNSYVCQGFIGGAADGSTTTLAREGSDLARQFLDMLWMPSR